MKENRIGSISYIVDRKTAVNAPAFLGEGATSNVRRLHESLAEYSPTPLVGLDAFAARLGIGGVYIKDESKRFGLNAFKGLGGVYAVSCLAARQLGLDPDRVTLAQLRRPENLRRLRDTVFVTTTDGNHGRGLSWACAQLGCAARVFMPKGSSELRAQAIRDVNPRAEVTVTDMGYDDAVRYAAKFAAQTGACLVQDTSWEGYEEVPRLIVQGYTTMAREACEALERLGRIPTHVLVQAGVGAMAGGVVGYIANRYPDRDITFAVAEPETMACVYESARTGDGEPHAARDQGETIMAGLNCGEPCRLTWPVLRDIADVYIKCPDSVAAHGMRLLAGPEGGDPAIVSGESGAVTAGLLSLTALPRYAALREALRLREDSVVLCFSTEGDTDPECYKRIVEGGAYPLED